MSDETPNPQSITAGDGNEIYQAAGNFTINNHAQVSTKTSSIKIPTDSEIRKYDPRVQQIIDVAGKEISFYHVAPRNRYRLFLKSPIFGAIFFVLFHFISNILEIMLWLYHYLF